MATRLDDCIFCNIIDNKAPSEKIYEDDYVTCIKNIHPVSTHHYLIIPKEHIRNAKELRANNAELYDKIVSTVNIISEKQGLDPAATCTGFHWPPFNTVHHLHLHVISPTSNISIINKIVYKPNSSWFVSTDYVKSYLEGRK
ncbi:unnamed protein product [Xylocopa violacea]|uniref:Adenosine 5'-monophosphoramidase HINT3 n=1 Tax=Xylocopa violacea TaxID=135666 RepID=A0ABP1NJE1_XYLVO